MQKRLWTEWLCEMNDFLSRQKFVVRGLFSGWVFSVGQCVLRGQKNARVRFLALAHCSPNATARRLKCVRSVHCSYGCANLKQDCVCVSSVS